MKRTMPELRNALDQIGFKLQELEHEDIAEKIFQIVEEMVRASPVRRAKVSHKPLSESEKELIRAWAKAHPDVHLADIATMFNVNPGRVSEALRG